MNERSENVALPTDERARKNGDAPAGSGETGVSGDSRLISKGLTKRELFAAMAMQAILTGAVTRGCPSNEWVEQEIAARCADALLKELAK
jgi:hypothetical protein